MITLNSRINKLFAATLGLSAIVLPTAVTSAPGTLASQPIFTQSAIDPNIMLVLDDSGSMDFETLFTTNDGRLWWEDDIAIDSFIDGAGLPFFNGDYSYVYLFPNGTGFTSGRRRYGNGTFGAIPPFIQYGFARSSDYNKAYYNPNVIYTPWQDYGTRTFGPITDFANVPADPYPPRNNGDYDFNFSGTGDIASNTSSSYGFRYRNNMIVPQGTVYNRGTGNITAASDIDLNTNRTDLGVTYHPATYYQVVGTGTYTVDDLSSTPVAGNCETPVQAHYTFFEQSPSSFTGSASTVDGLGPDGRCLDKVELVSADAEMQNFANWFSYYRKRHLALRAGLGLAFNNITDARVGMFTINNRNTVTMFDFETDKDTIYENFNSFTVNNSTPNRAALNHAGLQYERTGAGAPVIAECQKNFAVFFTDGFTADTTFGGPGNRDGNDGAPYADTRSSTLADIAIKYYEDNIRPDFPDGKVPVDRGCDTAPSPTQMNCNDNPHMVTYTIGLGAEGTIFNQTLAGTLYEKVKDVYDAPVTWPNVNLGRDPTQIDDLYHAAVNGRGEMLNAATPADLTEKLGEALISITDQVGSAAAVAFNTSVLSTGSVVYQARFNTDRWKGELLSFGIDPASGDVLFDGPVADSGAVWDAAEAVPNHDERIIYTYNPDTTKNLGVLFAAKKEDETVSQDNLSDSALPASAIADLQVDLPSTQTPNLTAKDRLNYLRGDRVFEPPQAPALAATNTDYFRQRDEDTVLGDIVHSAPLFVGNPTLSWPTGDGSTGDFPTGANSYDTWKDSINRTAVVYVGANDGMLHGFDATNGEELLAYIPSTLFSSNASEGLHYLSELGYQHQYYVDNTPSRTDAYVKGRNADGTSNSRDWRTVLVSTLRGGGKGVFALDITDPGNFSDDAAGAAKTALWEFDSSDDPDLGFTFSRPVIVPTNANDGANIRWAAIFGNGYNTEGAGSDCRAKLYVLFLDGGLDGTWTVGEGNDYLEIDTVVGSNAAGDCNGLSNVSVVDFDADGKADGVYAGDLKGNLWSFDLCNEDVMGVCQETGWGVAYDDGGPAPLFTAEDAAGNPQSITAAPIVITHPTVLSGSSSAKDPNVLVLFGTGQYLVDSDKDAPATTRHSYYGVWDRGDDSLERDDLFEQEFETGFGAGADFRVTGVESPNYTSPSAAQREYGWFLDLPDTSETDNSATGAPERVVTSAVVIGDIVFFNTLVPTTNGCDIGGYGYLMSVETKNGGRPDNIIVDITNDGTIDDSDAVTVDSENVAVTGIKTDSGILSEPTFLGGLRYESTSKGNILSGKTEDPLDQNIGRFSWTEIRDE